MFKIYNFQHTDGHIYFRKYQIRKKEINGVMFRIDTISHIDLDEFNKDVMNKYKIRELSFKYNITMSLATKLRKVMLRC